MGNFDMLPEEIVFEILSRLPTESALKCKLVSKPWRNVIQHPSFSQTHLNHLNKDVDSGKSGFISQDGEQFSYTEYDESLNRFSRPKKITINNRYCSLSSSCNGLLCFNALFENHYSPGSPAYICNPVTMEYIVLPKIESFSTGFGYVPSTNEYKVVGICEGETDPKVETVHVYTLGSGVGWRNVGNIPISMPCIREHGEFLNGAIYWVDGRKGTVVAFDLAAEELRVISSPPCWPRYGTTFNLQALGKFLCATCKCDGVCNIWVFKKNKNNQDMIWSDEFRGLNVTPITFTRTGVLICYKDWDDSFYRYTQASYSRIHVNFGENFIISGTPHKNTLVSLKALREEDVKLMDSGERARSSRETKSSDIISPRKRRAARYSRETQSSDIISQRKRRRARSSMESQRSDSISQRKGRRERYSKGTQSSEISSQRKRRNQQTSKYI